MLAAIVQTLQQLRGFDRDRRRGNLRLLRIVIHRARVRRLQTDRRDRTDQNRDGAVSRGSRRTRHPILNRQAIVNEGRVEDHDLAAYTFTKRVELSKVPHNDGFSGNTSSRGRDAVAESEHGELDRSWREQFQTLDRKS